ncbi:hypothetical protein B0H16DRAFT_1683356 [Mycena metata]|uniref:Uncharacterized protein n=1 Tax=Mycena metata TaxID=1033252 RepID=A0AAD7NXK5_9AGAR|nr:hypothetical protein B0H16DRAFT_1683356 [Mycena metata]
MCQEFQPNPWWPPIQPPSMEAKYKSIQRPIPLSTIHLHPDGPDAPIKLPLNVRKLKDRNADLPIEESIHSVAWATWLESRVRTAIGEAHSVSHYERRRAKLSRLCRYFSMHATAPVEQYNFSSKSNLGETPGVYWETEGDAEMAYRRVGIYAGAGDQVFRFGGPSVVLEKDPASGRWGEVVRARAQMFSQEQPRRDARGPGKLNIQNSTVKNRDPRTGVVAIVIRPFNRRSKPPSFNQRPKRKQAVVILGFHGQSTKLMVTTSILVYAHANKPLARRVLTCFLGSPARKSLQNQFRPLWAPITVNMALSAPPKHSFEEVDSK